MELLTVYQTKNRCYKKATAATHVGILMHSTGVVNRNVSRYVDAPERLGVNKYNNHWNSTAATKCMHSFIGYDINENIIVAETLPYEYACWGCGKGSKGSYNYNPTAHIQFEICQGSDTDSEYYWKVIAVAEEYCAYLCKKFGFTADDICSHTEAAAAGYASGHTDPEEWMKNFGDNMDAFRNRVRALLGQPIKEPTVSTIRPVVRKGDKNQYVREMQTLLKNYGYDLGSSGVDGSFGPATLTALKKFQKDVGLEVDGSCGPLTWAKLLSGKFYTITIESLTKNEAIGLKKEFVERGFTLREE